MPSIFGLSVYSDKPRFANKKFDLAMLPGEEIKVELQKNIITALSIFFKSLNNLPGENVDNLESMGTKNLQSQDLKSISI